MLAVFRGGPLDGQQHEMRDAPSVYRVLVAGEMTYTAEPAGPYSPTFETVDYHRVGCWSEPPHFIVYEAPGPLVSVAGLQEFRNIARGWGDIVRRFEQLPEPLRRSLHEHAQAFDVPAGTIRSDIVRLGQLGHFDGIPIPPRRPSEDYLSPDAHTVRFSEMSAEAEAEMAAWDEMLHGRH